MARRENKARTSRQSFDTKLKVWKRLARGESVTYIADVEELDRSTIRPIRDELHNMTEAQAEALLPPDVLAYWHLVHREPEANKPLESPSPRTPEAQRPGLVAWQQAEHELDGSVQHLRDFAQQVTGLGESILDGMWGKRSEEE